MIAMHNGSIFNGSVRLEQVKYRVNGVRMVNVIQG